MQQLTATSKDPEVRPSALEGPGMTASGGARLVSLDAFRGLTVAGMILVNNPGSWEYVYPPLRHARWHGWTPTDLVFPFFLFIVGVSLSYSFSQRLGRGATRGELYAKIVRRSALLFLIGLLLNAWEKRDGFGLSVPLESFRIFGVLQRIAVVYLAASLITLHTELRGRAIAAAACLLSYWALMKLVPVPGYGAGDLSYADHNLAAYLDRIVLRGHLAGKTWDGLGLVSTLPAVGSALAGVLTAHLLRSGRDKRDTAGWLFVAGWWAILAGLVWDLWFPINKLLWTSSYVVFTAGAALELLGVCYWLIEVEGWRGWAWPVIALGRNAITAFVLSTVVYLSICPVPFNSNNFSIRGWIYQNVFGSWANPYNASLGFAVAYVLLWIVVTAVLSRRRVFIKI